MIRVETAAYGKLPSRGDFVRHRGAAASTVLDRWFGEGLLECERLRGDAWEDAFDAAPEGNLFMRLPAGDWVAGSLRPSRDSLGRRYPFVVFATLGLEPGAGGLPLLAVLCEPFLDAASLVARAASAGDRVDLPSAVDALTRPAGAEDALRSLAWFLAETEAARLVKPDRRTRFLRDVASAASLRRKPRRTVSFAGPGSALEAAFWALLAERAARREPALAWRGADAMTFVFDRPAGPDFARMVLKSPAEEGPADAEGPGDDIFDAGATLGDLLERWAP